MIVIKAIGILCLITAINSITILPDNMKSGVIFQPYQTINFQEGSTGLIYKLNMSTLYTMQSGKNYIHRVCPNEHMNYEKMRKLWRENWEETELIIQDIEAYSIDSDELALFGNNIINLPNRGCNSLYKIEALYYEMEMKYREIRKLSYDNLINLIGSDRLMKDIKYKIMNLHNKYHNPITFSKLFISDLIKTVTTKYAFNDNTIFIEFEIPYFIDKKITLYKINPKPFIYNNEFYIMKTDVKFAIIEEHMQNLYTEKLYEENCFSIENAYYCRDGKLEKQSECEYEYISVDERFFRKHKFNETCFEKLQRSNKITQVGKQIYFSIVKPLDVYVSHNKIDYVVSLESSAKIIEQIDYSLRTPFFDFKPENQPRYEMFEQSEVKTLEKIFNFENEVNKNLNVIIIVTIIVLITIVFILVSLKYYFVRKNENMP